MKKYLELLPLSLLLLFIAKMLLISSQISDAIIVAALVGLTAFFEYQAKNKALLALNARIEAFESRLDENEGDINLIRGKLSIQTLGNSLTKQSLNKVAK